MPEDAPVTATPETPATPAAVETPNVTETPEATQLATQENETLKDVREAREAEEAKGKPAAEVETPKDEAKEGDEKEPENLTEAEKNKAAWLKKQRDTQLSEAAKLADERKALDAEKAELEKAKAEIASQKQTAPEKKADAPVDQPVAATLENFKPIELASYQDGDNENEIALKAGIEALAKDVQAVKTEYLSEIERLKADNARLMKLAEPYIPDEHGVTQAEIQGAAQQLRSNAEKASEALMAQFGPDSGLVVDPVSLIAALQEFGQGFVRIGEIKADQLLTQESILHCWHHANKAKLDELKAGPAKPKEEKLVPPPVRKEEGKSPAPPRYEDMTEREKILYDIQQENALLNGRK